MIVTVTLFHEICQVGVVVHLLGHGRQPVHEVHRAGEVVELELLHDRVALAAPALELPQPGLDLLVAQQRHLPSSRVMRIASLVPSSTEMLYALGLGDSVVAVTHECDYPPEAAVKPHLTRSVIPEGLPPAEIDAAVRERTGRGEALYELDEATLRELEPDLIVTQAVCEVCAVSFDDVRAVAERLPSRAARALARPVDDRRGAGRRAAPRGGRRRGRGGRARWPRTPPARLDARARRGRGRAAPARGRARVARPGLRRRPLGARR